MTKNLGLIKKLNTITLAFFTASLLSVGFVHAMDKEEENEKENASPLSVETVARRQKEKEELEINLQKRLKRRAIEKLSPELNGDEVESLKKIIKQYPEIAKPSNKDYKNIQKKMKKKFPSSTNLYSKQRLRLEINAIRREEKNPSSKRKRGRPKGSSNKAKILVDVTNKQDQLHNITTLNTVKPKRGRPKGSSNKMKILVDVTNKQDQLHNITPQNTVKRKRGRPKGTVNKKRKLVDATNKQDQLHNVTPQNTKLSSNISPLNYGLELLKFAVFFDDYIQQNENINPGSTIINDNR